jgi:predicted small lipoprotein YifL
VPELLNIRPAYALERDMKKLLPFALASLAILAACGRQEPVDDLPSQEELAAAANAAAANAAAVASADKTEENRNYVNLVHGFSVTFPEGWTKDPAASTAEGVVYQDPGAGADVRVFWQRNADDKDLQQIVEAVSSGSDSIEGDFVGGNEYRGTSADGEGNGVAVRLLKQPDGSIVTATFVYPENLGEQYNPIAKTVLDSLRIFAPEGGASAPAATPAAATGNSVQ